MKENKNELIKNNIKEIKKGDIVTIRELIISYQALYEQLVKTRDKKLKRYLVKFAKRKVIIK